MTIGTKLICFVKEELQPSVGKSTTLKVSCGKLICQGCIYAMVEDASIELWLSMPIALGNAYANRRDRSGQGESKTH